MKFIPVDPKDIDTSRAGRRGRVSYPIIKGFMETNQKVCKLDLTGITQNPTYLRSVLTAYIKSHKMPIKVFAAQGELHMMRLDLNNDNEPIEWTPEEAATEIGGGKERNAEPTPITDDEVDERFAKEKGAVTK